MVLKKIADFGTSDCYVAAKIGNFDHTVMDS